MSTMLCWIHQGDSIGASGGTWPFLYIGQSQRGDSGVPATQAGQCYRKSDGTILLKNCAISGTRLASGSNNVAEIATAYVDPTFAVKTVTASGNGSAVAQARAYLVTCAIGSNDGCLGGYSTVDEYAAAVATAMQLRRTAGADYIALCTILPRDDAAGPLDETNRVNYNALLTNSSWRASNNIDFVIDLASEATMGVKANCSNATYYNGDKIHPTATGQQLLVDNVVTPAMASIIAAIG